MSISRAGCAPRPWAQTQAWQAVGRNAVTLHAFGGVHDLQAIGVFDKAVLHQPCERGTVPDHIDPEGRAQGEVGDERTSDRHEDHAVEDDPWPEHTAQALAACEALSHAVLGVVADQVRGAVHLLHHVVADIDACRAADAFLLRALANVDAGGADLHA